MSNKRPTFRLHIFGQLGDYTQPLLTFAEFNQSRAVERVALDEKRVNTLSERIRDLHLFIETNSPAWEPAALDELGGQLCELVLQGKVRALFDTAVGARPELLPFEIFVEDPAITSWPWEYLYDAKRGRFLSQEFYPISRGIFGFYADPQLSATDGKVRILLVIGVLPEDQNTTPATEIQWINDVFDTKLATDSVQIKVMQAVNPLDLDKEIQRGRYDVLHFFGHARFDGARDEGYLKLERRGAEPYSFYAENFAQLLANKGLRLVFLNACESGRTSRDEDPARSSIAAALLARGVPAVIATQFSIPDVTAHYLSSMIYNGLVLGKPLVAALQDGRRAMNYAPRSKFTDWGIPVLYTSDPDLVIFPTTEGEDVPKWAYAYERSAREANPLRALGTPSAPKAPSLSVERTAVPENKSRAKMRVALIDIDAKVGFLPDLAEQANRVQHYYNFEVTYIPIPSGAIRTDLTASKDGKIYPQLFLPLVEEYLVTMPEDLKVDKVCCLTRCRIAGIDEKDGPFQDFRASALNSSEDVIAISVYKLRDYAEAAAISYAKATLYVCLGMIVATDERYPPFIHEETAGCLFDDCENRDDILIGLKKMRFDHEKCRNKITVPEQLSAIDALMALDLKTDEQRSGAENSGTTTAN